MENNQLIVVLVTVPNEETASALARDLVQERHAACVNILPNIRSIYTWEGKLEDESELLLVIKTVRACYKNLEQAIIERHPYDTPEIVALDAATVADKYLR